jgi:hypothetical protein
MDELSMLEWVGVNGETYRLYLSAKKLAEHLPADVKRLRFFPRGFPYYVLEGVSPPEEEEEGVKDTEQEGKNGANKYAYWVIQSIESGAAGWTKLPNVTMEQVPIPTHPNFLINHYLIFLIILFGAIPPCVFILFFSSIFLYY